MQKYLLLLFPCRNCNSGSQQHKLCHRMLLSSDMTTCSALLHCNGPLQKKKDNSSSLFSLSGASIWKKMHNCIFRLQFLTSVLFIFRRWLIICDSFLFIYFFCFSTIKESITILNFEHFWMWTWWTTCEIK